jgi:phosphonate transport system substrate-binding protein
MKHIFGSIILVLLGLTFAQVDKTDWPAEIVFATVPVETTEDATAKMKPLVDYLSETLGIPVNFRNGADYAAVTIAMQSEQVDVAWFGPSSYLDAHDQAGAEAVVKENSIESGDGYYSVIIAKKGSGLASVEDLQGLEFAFVDPGSTSGFRVPMYSFCNKLGIEPNDYFERTFFAGTHENVILGVLNGTIQVGATYDLGIVNAVNKGQVKEDDFDIVFTSDKIPASPIAVRGSLPDSLKQEIQRAFLEFDDTEFLTNLGFTGFLETSHEDYEFFREVNQYKEVNCL